MSDEEYEEASPEQKLSIATYFIMSSPVGEVDFVLADTKKLIGSDEILSKTAITNILKEYNIDLMCTAPTSDGPAMVSSYGMVSDTEFVDPKTGKVLVFDHLRREFTSSSDSKQALDSSIDDLRKAVQKKVDEYVSNTYKEGKCVPVVYGADNGDITICLSAVNTKISAYWTGGWNSVFTFNCSTKSDAELNGDVKAHVHYFEDGNVQLHTAINKKVTVKVDDDHSVTADSVIKAISKIETDYQSSLEEMYVDMHRNTFKEMRRFLPISKQPMEWTPFAHGVGLMN